MARTQLVVTPISRAGAYVAQTTGLAAGAQFDNDGRVFLEVSNVHATLARSITIVTPKTVLGLAVTDLVVSIPAVSNRRIGPFPTAEFNNTGADAGQVYIDFPAGTESDIHVSAYRF